MIRILTGHSDGGGSTIAHINLCNLLNDNGYECKLYGRDMWHLDKCNSGLLTEVKMFTDDTIIVHFLPVFERPPVETFILSLHEKELYPLNKINYKAFDKIHYIRESQRKWHDVDHPYFECMYIQNKLLANEKTCDDKVAGVIGSVDPNKQIHISIQRALDEGFDDIRLFGKIVIDSYYVNEVLPLINKYPDIIQRPTFAEDKQEMYDQITDVFHTSKLEVCPYIQGECILTNTNFHGNDQTEEEYKILTDEEILNIWVEELDLIKDI